MLKVANKETNGFEVVFKFPDQEGRRCKADSECSIISFFINYLSSNASEIWEDMRLWYSVTRESTDMRHFKMINKCAYLNEPEYKKLEKLPTESCNAGCMVNDEEI